MSKHKQTNLFSSLLLLLAGGIIGGLVEEVLDYRRELRENTQQFVDTFNSTYYGAARDTVHMFYLEEETIRRTSGENTVEQYYDWTVSEVRSRPDLSAAVFAIAEFYGSVSDCASARRCNRASISDAFSGYSSRFLNVFFPVLRDADCNLRFPDFEETVASIANIEMPDKWRCGSKAVPF